MLNPLLAKHKTKIDDFGVALKGNFDEGILTPQGEVL